MILFITDHPYLCAWMCAVALLLFIAWNTPKEKKMLQAKTSVEDAAEKVYLDLIGSKNEDQLETARQAMEHFRIMYNTEQGIKDYNALCFFYNQQRDKLTTDYSSEYIPLCD